MPTYFAGRVNGLTGVINAGSDVTAVRNSVGTYTLTLPATASNRFLMTTVTPSANTPPSPVHTPVVARVTSTSRSAVTPKVTTVIIEIRDLTGGSLALIDCDFEFVAVERSGS
jgi:hypothetical protein